MNPYAAIDQGTTSTRALVTDDAGQTRIALALRHEQHYPRPGWVEHDPLALLENVRACLRAAGPAQAIGLANQGESCLAWDADSGEPLSPVIVWQDVRGTEQLARLRADGAESLTRERAGLPLDAYFSAVKLSWLMTHNPAVARARRAGRLRLGTTDAFLLDRLTGRWATDASTASRTSLMNLRTGQWDPDLCELFGIPIECLPPIQATVGDFGVCAGVPITASIVDQQAALYGHGCRAPGDAKITFGTGAFALALAGNAPPGASGTGLLPTVAWRFGEALTYALDGGVYDAGGALEWISRLGLLRDWSELQAFDGAPAIDRGLLFVPALSGLACPHWDREAAAMWLGMNASTSREDLCRAVLEGVALRTAQVIQAMTSRIDLAPCLTVDGGLTRSAYFCQFLADILERSIVTRDVDELTALGAAALAARGAGGEPGFSPRATAVHEPRGTPAATQLRHQRYAAAVDKTRGWRGI